jgi:Arc/MetJ-type ribon-helix-helix transcriptional regulator
VSKEKISVTLDAYQVREISDLVGEEYESRSEAIRSLINKGLEYDDLQIERDRLEQQLTATNRRVDQHQELVEYVQEERELQRTRGDLEKRRAQAGLWTKARWALFGMREDEVESES